MQRVEMKCDECGKENTEGEWWIQIGHICPVLTGVLRPTGVEGEFCSAQCAVDWLLRSVNRSG